MKKKILSLILVAAMLASMLVFVPVSGATEDAPHGIVDVQDAVGQRGEQVTVDVVITMDAKDGKNAIPNFQGVFEYDTSRLEYAKGGVIRTEIWETDGNKPADGANGDVAWTEFIKEGYCSAYGVNCKTDASAGLVAFKITFTIKEDAPLGDAFVTFRYLSDDCILTYNTVVEDQLNQPGDVDYLPGVISVMPKGYDEFVAQDGLTFVENADGETATLTDYAGTATTLDIPAYVTVNGKVLKVTKIGSFVFADVNENNELIYTENASTGKYTVARRNNTTVTKIVVPATVEEIADYAFINGTKVKQVVINGNPTLGELCIATTGATWNTADATTHTGAFKTTSNIKFVSNPTYVEPDDWYSVADTGIEANFVFSAPNAATYFADYVENFREQVWTAASNAFAETGETLEDYGCDSSIITFNLKNTKAASANMIFVVEGEKTTIYNVTDALIAPATTPSGANVAVWTDANGAVVLPGAAIEAGTVLTAVVAEAPLTNNGVTMKPTTDNLAMRFTANISKATYDAMNALGGTLEVGMLIAPRQYVLGANKVFTMEALGAWAESKGAAAEDAYVKVVATRAYKAYTADGAETTDFDACASFDVAASIENFSDNTVAKNPEFVSIAYLTVTFADETAVTVYGNFGSANASSVGGFLKTLEIPEDLGDTVKAAINVWKEKFGIN